MANFKRIVLTERDNTVTEKTNVKPTENKNSIKKQLEKFDTNYTSQKLNELYDEFDSITLNSPSISDLTLKKENIVVATQSNVSMKTKIYLASAVLAVLLLAFLSIFNIFVINDLNGGIKLLQQDVISTEYNLKDLYDVYKDLNNTSKLEDRVKDGGFVDLPVNSIDDITLIDISQVAPKATQTNWFDKLCEFLGVVFGG